MKIKLSWKGLGEASTKFSMVLIIVVAALIVTWMFGTAQGHNDALAYARTEAQQYVQEIEKRDAMIVSQSVKLADYRLQLEQLLFPHGETLLDCVIVTN